jgi:hypothetical protein
MHKFDLQRALAGEPLITRKGDPIYKFRIVGHNADFPYEADDATGYTELYTDCGRVFYSIETSEDLFMLHETSGNASDASAPEGTPVESGFPSWQPIETAPKGGGAERVTDPAWVDPPKILLAFDGGAVAVCYWDYYYDHGGMGFQETAAWVCQGSDELAASYYGDATHWMPLPAPPTK